MTESALIRTQVPLIGKLIVKSTLIIETGIHIGGGGETLDIGGLDHAVVRNPLNRYPYIPGSSIKGKLRALVERYKNLPLNRISKDLYRHECDHIETWLLKVEQGHQSQPGAKDCPVCRVFGSTGVDCLIPASPQPVKKKGDNKPACLIIRDSQLLEDSAQLLEKIDTGLYMTEWKFENGLDRITAAANPRQVERVPAGSRFNFEMVYTVENESHAQEDLKNIAIALAILEDDALGGHGSRGYGKVRFENFQFYYRGLEQYKQMGLNSSSLLEPFQKLDNTAALLSNFGTLSQEFQTKLLPGNSNAE